MMNVLIILLAQYLQRKKVMEWLEYPFQLNNFFSQIFHFFHMQNGWKKK